MKLLTPQQYQNLTQEQVSNLIKLGDERAFAEAINRFHQFFLFSAYQILKDNLWAQDCL